MHNPNPIAFFDVDSLVLSPNGRTYVCHPQSNSISDELYELYSVISALSAPVIFSVDVNEKSPDSDSKRKDFLTIPASEADQEWKESVTHWKKFYINRTPSEQKEIAAIFNNNKNALDCVKSLKPDTWVVFGNDFKNGVDHVISTLLQLKGKVQFAPEFIVPSSAESEDELEAYCQKWEALGAEPISYNQIAAKVAVKKNNR